MGTERKKIIVLNPPGPDNYYINRDLMGGMGVKNYIGSNLGSRILSKLKSNLIRLPVLQLVYCATVLYNAGYNVKVIDAQNDGTKLDKLLILVKEFAPDYVVMAVSSSSYIYERDVIAAKIKETLPSVKVVALGDMVKEMPSIIKPNFDIGIMAEVETCILSIVEDKKLKDIPGIAYLDSNNIKITHEKEKLSPEELITLSFPKWDLFPFHKYKYHPMLTVHPVATILASRGCPYGCGYCPYPKNQGLQWRARSAENIFNEIVEDITKYGFKGIFFRDPLFSLNQKRVEDLCDLLIKNNVKVNFVFETRPELLKKELIKKLYDAGCRAINFGIEDIHPEILKQINRIPFPLDKIKETIHECEKVGIRTSCFFILGLPGSTRETIEETISWSLDLFPSQIEYKVATPFPGTSLYDMAKKNNWLIHESIDNLGGYTSVMQISPELNPEYLEKRASKAFNQFYFRPKYMFRELFRGRIYSALSIINK